MIYRWLLIGIVVLFSSEVWSQSSDDGYFQLETRRNGAARFNFELFNNLVLVPVIVNNSSDTLKMILDTGVAKTLITGLPNGEEVNLNYTEVIRIAGLGEGESIEAFYSQGNKLQVNRTTGKKQVVLVLKEDIFSLSTFLGTFVHGLIGHSLFKDFIVEIDYDQQWIKLHDHERFGDRYFKKKESPKWSSVPLSFRNDKPYVDVEVQQKDGSWIPLTLLIDTGASFALSLYYSENDRILLPEKRVRSFLGNGLSGEIQGYFGRIERLKIANFTFKEPIASFPDEEGIMRSIVFSSRDGSIGAEIMKRFKVMFNYRDSTMIIKPSDYFKDDFFYNKAGIEIGTPFPNIQLYQVTYVRENSAADIQGLQEGDFITEINGRNSSHFTLNEVINLMQGREGNKIRMKIVRDDSTFRKELYLTEELD